jgi:hypothetical protein
MPERSESVIECVFHQRIGVLSRSFKSALSEADFRALESA